MAQPEQNKATFLWGAATSAHQVEANNIHSDWWEWESKGMVKERSGLACDHYHRFKEDLMLARRLGHNAHRFSLEWSRLEPREGVWDNAAWDHYRDVIGTLRELQLEPLVTLNHFTIPNWLGKKGGWMHPDAISHFRRYVSKAAEQFGRDVTYWITLNEPMIYVKCAYLFGKWPPGKTSFDDAIIVIGNLIRAHVAAYEAIHEKSSSTSRRQPSVGMAKNVYAYEPFDNGSVLDRVATWVHHRYYNHLFLASVMDGVIRFPGFKTQRLEAREAMDFIGVNYYSREYVQWNGLFVPGLYGKLRGMPSRPRDRVSRNTLGWEVYPKGLSILLTDLSRYGMPLMVTENGMSARDDEERSQFIKDHLAMVFGVRREGVPVCGFFYWSLLDNFEWSDGYGPRFGLIEMDYRTQERKIRNSAFVYTRLMNEWLAK